MVEYTIMNNLISFTVGSLFEDQIVYNGTGQETPFRMFTPKYFADCKIFKLIDLNRKDY